MNIALQYSVLTIGDPEAAVKVDSFIDLACSDTKATWPTLKKVMSHYEEKGVEFRYHLFPLPYHTVRLATYPHRPSTNIRLKVPPLLICLYSWFISAI